ncbi:MAG: hypothetical protein ACFFDW_03965 [Candidatus Thorarchaeota archaeon]
MTSNEFQNLTNTNIKSFTTTEENKSIRNNPLYKGQLSYLKEIILVDCPNIDPDSLSEKLDIPISTAILLLKDCQK